MGSNAPRAIRVFLFGSQPVVMAGLRLLFESADGFSVVGKAALPPASAWPAEGDGVPVPAIDSSPKRPDVILVDIDGGTDSLLPVLSPSVPRGTRVVILASALDEHSLALAFRHGVTGAVLKSEAPEVLFDAVRQVHAGQVWLDKSSTTQLVVGLSEAPQTVSREARRAAALTPRERQAVALVGEGLTNANIASTLTISQVTVRNHLTSIFRKLRLSSRFQLALYAFKHGLSKMPPTSRPRRAAAKQALRGRKRTAS